MSYLRGFIPWIAFAALSSAGWQWGALAALAIGVWLLLQDRRAGVAADAQMLEISTVGYFALLTALAFAAPHSPLEHYDGALSFAWLALTAWGTLAAGRPFTLGIAKRQTPEEFWDSPVFLRINTVLTAAWAISFTLTAVATAACSAADAGTLARVACQVVGFAAPAVFTSRYPKAVQARLANAATAAAAAPVR
ncbi:hypothetical protein [Streptacidiphilus sp. PAMC 29251]